MTAKKILFVTTEITPYVPDTEWSVTARRIHRDVLSQGHDIRTFMPKYGCVNERRNQLHEVIRLSGMNLIIDDTDHPLIIKVASMPPSRVQIYFIDNDDFFHRKELFRDDNGVEFIDNDERCIFYARGVMETAKKLRWAPDLIHCHGWMTALVPLYLKKHYRNDPSFKNSKVVYSVYNDDFQQPLRTNFYRKAKLSGITLADLKTVEKQPTFENLNKLAIDSADAVMQSSAEINPVLKEYIQTKDIPFLDYQPAETAMTAQHAFYDSLIGAE